MPNSLETHTPGPSSSVAMLTLTDLAAPTGGDGDSNGGGRCVDSQLWAACAGSMSSVPPVGAAVYYFPQGHAEQASAAVAEVDLSAAARVPPLVPCRVVAMRFMADAESDEVFARIRLVPLRPGDAVVDVGEAAAAEAEGRPTKPASFAKTLTQSDANNGGGFSVPRFCAETIFPELDYSTEPPVQYVYAKDVHGEEWRFRHIYRGTPRRHLLTTGWSGFVNQKKLLAGDSIVFMRDEAGNVHVGIRRAKRGFCGGVGDDEGLSSLLGWGLMRVNASAASGGNGATKGGKVPPENVLAAARMAASGQPFEVLYYPRAGTPEFCVRAGAVRTAMSVQWCPGMRFKMAFETEDSSRISWFMGTVAAVQPADPIRWPRSPWRLLQVTWDEPELLQNVKRVCPWVVELVSSMPNLHLPSFSPPPLRKKPRIPPYGAESSFPLDAHHLFAPAAAAAFPSNPTMAAAHGFPFPPFFPDSSSSAQPAGIQGARHAHFAPSFKDLHTVGNLQPNLLLYPGIRLPPADHAAAAAAVAPPPTRIISTDLTIGSPFAPDADGAAKPAGFLLFGQAILTEEQIKNNGTRNRSPNASEGSDSGLTEGSPTTTNNNNNHTPSPFKPPCSGHELELGQCKVYVQSEDIGRSLDISELSSFEELYARLSDMFSIDGDGLSHTQVVYNSLSGKDKHAGDEPFCEFLKSARKLRILIDAGSAPMGS